MAFADYGPALLVAELGEVPGAEGADTRKPAHLPAAKGLDAGPGAGGRTAAAVGVDDAGLRPLQESLHFGFAFAHDARAQTVLGIVRQTYRLVQVIDLMEEGDRQEVLGSVERIDVRDAGDEERLHEVTPCRLLEMIGNTRLRRERDDADRARIFPDRVVEFLVAVERRFVDHRPYGRRPLCGVTDTDCGDAVAIEDGVNEVVGDSLVHVNPRQRTALLAGESDDGFDDAGGGLLDVGPRGHDERILAAHFRDKGSGNALLPEFRTDSVDSEADFFGTSESDEGNPRIAHERITYGSASAIDDGAGTIGCSGFGEDLGEDRACNRRVASRLEHYGISGEECADDVVCRKREREVEGRDHRDRSHRLKRRDAPLERGRSPRTEKPGVTAGLFAEAIVGLDHRGDFEYLRHCLAARFSNLEREDGRDIELALFDDLRDAAQDAPAFAPSQFADLALCATGLIDCTSDAFGRTDGDGRESSRGTGWTEVEEGALYMREYFEDAAGCEVPFRLFDRLLECGVVLFAHRKRSVGDGHGHSFRDFQRCRLCSSTALAREQRPAPLSPRGLIRRIEPMPYDPKTIEPKWQKYWEERAMHRAEDFSKRPKRYILDMFPYPSGEGLHVGHVEGYTATDILARYARMKGFNVLHPMGWDAFGLPAENAALKEGVHPRTLVQRNVARFRGQIRRLGFSYDWAREISTADPAYYKWTQWIFLQLFKRGLAYEAKAPINFCPKDKTGLANEEVVQGKCERCGTPVERRMLRQWMLKITAYADRLLSDLEKLDWPEKIKEMQRNWIGRSEGGEIVFPVRRAPADYVFLHCYKGTPEGHFRDWLKRELEREGHKVAMLALPNPAEPNIEEQVAFVLTNAAFTRNTIVVTHSLGGVVALKLLPKLSEPIAKLVMVAPPLRPEFLDHPRKNLEQCTDWQFDFSAVKEKASEIVVLSDLHDDVVPPAQPRELAEKLGATLVEAIAREQHFCAKEEPFVWEYARPHLRVFTTRADTLFGATYVVVAPEHPLMTRIENRGLRIENHEEATKYVREAKQKSDLERQEGIGDKTGVRIEGVVAVNPVNGEELPIFVADYVLGHYGTGAIMAVPAHDERDFAFAQKHDLLIREVVTPDGKTKRTLHEAFEMDGILVNSGDFSRVSSADAREKITAWLAEQGRARTVVHYKLRDWVFSRQRYWGEPIPLVHCDRCGVVPVPEEQLPVLLPDIEQYEPTGTGESPLSAIQEWVNVSCPQCGGAARRETNTMPQWAGSCWYYLRYLDPHSAERFVGEKEERYWMPVDLYLGGAEHAVLHLLYGRFWHKILFDEGLVSTDEPFRKLFNQGLILGPDNQKMSKSRGNIINPDDVIDAYGADTLRMYEMFMGPLEDGKPWDTKGIVGIWRFLKRVYAYVAEAGTGEVAETAGSTDGERLRHRTIRKATEDIENFRFNTAISALMEYLNAISRFQIPDSKFSETLVLLLAPFAPHLCEELWQETLGKTKSVFEEQWPTYDESMTEEDMVTVAIQVNGKTRGQIRVKKDADERTVRSVAEKESAVARHLKDIAVSRVIFVPDRLMNFVGK